MIPSFNLIWLLGIFLLYAVPIMVFMYESVIRRVAPFIQQSAMPLSLGLTIFMIWALHSAVYVFVFYFALFWICQFLFTRWGACYSDSLVLPIYLCFALSVLWEWPVQLTVPQHFDSLLASGFKALGIPFLYLKLRKMGWRPDTDYYMMIMFALLIGSSIAGFIYLQGIKPSFWLAQGYRLPWIAILLLGVRDTYLNKLSTPQSQLVK